MVERVTYKCLPAIAGPYAHAIKHKGILYLSGLTAMGTSFRAGDIESQCESVVKQIADVLATEQCSQENLIKLTVFVKDIAGLKKIRELLSAFYQGTLPACSLVEVSNLIHPDLVIEIEAIIALPDA